MANESAKIPAKRVVFRGKQEVRFEEFELPASGEGQVLLRTQFSLMSTGTENIIFNRLFDPGTSWAEWVKYPFYPGYSAVARVESAGSGALKEGDFVAVRYGHQSHGVLDASDCVRIPEGVSLEHAAWFALAKIAFLGARASKYELGDGIVIIGAGPIGQMSVRWARASGVASIIVVDPEASRLELAQKGGATATISAPIEEAREAILAANDGKPPGTVIDSTGNAKVFAQGLGLLERFGRMVVLGDTGQPASQSLTSDVIIKGLTIVGAHDGHHSAEWNPSRISRLFFQLVADGRFPMADMNTHYFSPTACLQAYETANRERGKTMGIVFDWRKET